MKNQILLVIVSLCFGLSIFAQTEKPKSVKAKKVIAYVPTEKALYDTIFYQDNLLFTGFNRRKIEKLKDFFADNLEVFQDNIGVRFYEQTIESFRELFAKDYVLTRTLVKNSLEVYAIKDYGAIETGKHTFCHTENGKLNCATYKFVMIWEKKNEQWKITKIITYDHKL